MIYAVFTFCGSTPSSLPFSGGRYLNMAPGTVKRALKVFLSILNISTSSGFFEL